MKAYKGFHKNENGELVCNGFVFKEGETYTHDGDVKLCESGFHACEAPVDCLGYYAPATSEFHEVELIDATEEKSDDTKRVSKTIKIGAKLTVAKICELQFNYVNERCDKKDSATGPMSANSATGYGSANSATGYGSANSATGPRSANSATGPMSANSATGPMSANSATGYGSANSATGYGSANSATGYGSANSATGYGSANVSTGTRCKNSGADSTINVAWGRESACKGEVGAYIVLSEWGDYDGEKYPLLAAKMVKIDGKRYKPDTWYTLKDGKVVKYEEDSEN